MLKRNKLALSISAAVLSGGLMAPLAVAQEAALEEITVTGIRGALQDAVNIKRDATDLVDAVSAEDVGKFPDSDVGEALGRIPGITVGRAFGQGASVSIRGAAPTMTLTQLNGQNVASTGWFDNIPVDRSFNYSLLPAELIGGIEVYKSSRADLNEGGIGGTVIVKTRKPLDLDSNTAWIGTTARVGTVSDEVAPEVSGLYSWKNDEETFGVLVSAAKEDREYVRRGTESDYRWSGDVAPTTFLQDQERTALDLTLQYAPTEELSFTLHAMSLDMQADNTNTSLYLFTLAGDNVTCHTTNAAGLCTSSTTENSQFGDLAPGWASGAPGNETFNQTWGRKSSMSSDTFDFNTEYEGEGFRVSGNIGSTKADGGTDFTTNFSHFPSVRAGDTMSLWQGSIDATGKEIIIKPTLDPSLSLEDYGDVLSPEGWAVASGPVEDEESYAQLDVEFDLNVGVLTSFKTGVRWTDHDVNRSKFRGIVTNPAQVAASDVYNGTFEVGQHGFTAPKPNLGAMVAATRDSIDSWVEERAGYSELNEENTALYGMFTFESGALSGNFGLRYISTDATRTQYDLDGTEPMAGEIAANIGYAYSLSSYSADYSDVLPSATVRYELAEDWVLRASASQAISRPTYDDMLVTYAGFADDRADNQTQRFGSEGLQPMKATSADIALEYYYGDGNLVSATYFVKSIDDFVTSEILIDQQIGLEDPAGGDSWAVESLKNAGGADIQGLELQIQHAFDNGFGVAANYTYTDAEAPKDAFMDQLPIFTESSEHAYNLVGYWENDTFSARAAYNFRSEYLIRDGGYWYGNRMHDDFGSLDLSFYWYATDNLDVTFEAINVLEEDDIQYGAASADTSATGMKGPLQEGFPAWSFQGEAVYQLGASYKF
ncbi:TonB-dependent receptor [Microbulbifer sp. CAU 1566]|uniref:TonB-dependent receptor n=1 Tax=Microbulbifer sp. CAU 1566 TaxID=2933269 RepID=UPI0020055717|nr:TonB-dependent receptor [Microbulbifer sp. CAU 1566]MCK7598356.1 TonB-dependent receptor [Microbulbifer sp. CAU 1566]